MIEVTCSHCGSSIEKYPSKVERTDNHFCDGECYGNWRSENVSGREHPQSDRVEVECSWCSESFDRPRSRAEKFETQFCSGECESEWKSVNLIGQENPNWSRETTECSWCDAKIKVVPSRFDVAEKLFCSSDCYGNWLSENVTGDSHPNFKGGYRQYYGDEWEQVREEIRNRDGGVCQACGKSRDDNGRRLSVHHIVPVREFDDPNEAHTHNNLVQVCDDCHPKLENLPEMEQRKIVGET